MDVDARRKPPASHSLQPPPAALFRARSGRVADLAAGVGAGAAFAGPPDTPPRSSHVTVPFVWEDAPGKPRAASPTAWATAAETPATATNVGRVLQGETGDHQDRSGHAELARSRPLKLPPRLQRVESFAAADTRHGVSGHADRAGPPLPPLKLPPRLQQVPVPPSFAAGATDYTPSPSPNTVLQGPYYNSRSAAGSYKPPKWVRSGGAALKRTPSAGMALLSRTLSKRRAAPGAVAPAASGSGGKNRGSGGAGDHERDSAAGPGSDAPWYSPASSSSSSSVSTRFGGEDQHGGRGRHVVYGREAASDEEEEDNGDGDGGGSPRGLSVRITRFTRNRSLPNLNTSGLWASVRRSVKQITPILHGARSWATTRYGH